jgi:hypothetical protein
LRNAVRRALKMARNLKRFSNGNSKKGTAEEIMAYLLEDEEE